MPNIVLTRIDNRLVHGQVATQWCGAIGANLILVANDEVACYRKDCDWKHEASSYSLQDTKNFVFHELFLL